MSEKEIQGYIVEYIASGKSIKVTAIDPQTMLEVSMIGAHGVARKELARLAIRKLQYVLNRAKSE